MKTRVTEPLSNPVPAAEYVRMSDEGQPYSIENQKAANAEYAARNGFVIVKTYADAGRSGVIAKNRIALRQLLTDVISGEASYRAILVYDVSRWGRFPNNDEAAHYEFLCSSSGIPLHYCAEQFANDGTVTSSIIKALKRTMAAEFSRELGEKVFRGKSRLVQKGFWVGAMAGCGYRRMMISAEGKQKQILKHGEHKSLTTDRVILVLGPRHEVDLVRKIFSMAVDRVGCTDIARQLNARGLIRPNGREWKPCDVRNIVTNPKYAGCNVWGRGSQRLRTNRVPVEAKRWITKPEAFVAIIDQSTFDRAQAALPRRADRMWSNEEIIRAIRRLLARKGRLSISLVEKARGMPSSKLIRNRFGCYRELYKRIGYYVPEEDLRGDPDADPYMRLRRNLVARLKEMFPKNVTVTHLPGRYRSILQVDGIFMVSVLLCPFERPPKCAPYWMVQPNPAERDYVTLVCKLNPYRTGIYSYYLFPRTGIPTKTYSAYRNDRWFKTGKKLMRLSEFYAAATAAWRAQPAQRKLDSSIDNCAAKVDP